MIAVRKSKREQVQVATREYRGEAFIDVRIFYFEGGEAKPSPKGVMLPLDSAEALIDAIRQVAEQGDADG